MAPPSKVSFLAHAGVFLHYAGGAWYPRGGGQPIADALLRVITDNGGQVPANAGRRDSARGRSGGRACTPPGRGPPPGTVRHHHRTDRGVQRGSETHLHWASAGRCCAGQTAYPDAAGDYSRPVARGIPHPRPRSRSGGRTNTNWWVYPDDDLDRAYAQVAQASCRRAHSLTHVRQPEGPGSGRLARPGQTNIQIMTAAPADHRFWGCRAGTRGRRVVPAQSGIPQAQAAVARGPDAQRGRAIPGISDSVIYSESATPITHERFVRSTGGTSYSLAATPDQMLLKRPSARTAIKGLWIVGPARATCTASRDARRRHADCCVNSRRSRLSSCADCGCPTYGAPSLSSTFRSAPRN